MTSWTSFLKVAVPVQWAIVLVFILITVTVAPAAVNAVLGAGLVATVCTLLLFISVAVDRKD